MYKEIIRPLLGKLDSETWHVRARDALHFTEATPLTLKLLEQCTYQRKRFCDERLQVTVGGVTFDNPVVVGAGWDKAGRAVQALYTLGFAGVEVGSVLAQPQDGNPKPRQFMLSPGVALNRLGFNGPGMHVVAANLARYAKSGIPIGISLGKNKQVQAIDAPEAHAVVAERLYDYAAYFAINVSSPNTPGLRALQEKGPLTDIVQAVNNVMESRGGRKPLFVKIAPELSLEAVDDVIEVVLAHGLTGIIATNTTTSPEIKATYGERWRNEAGGVSGDDPAYRAMATAKVAHIYRATKGTISIIGVGGVKDAPTALEKIKAGATLVQVVTAIRGEGTSVAGRINRGLVAYMEKEGVHTMSELVGIEGL
ncbi:MAG TPA: quinone-dependent dihydroorotate dehydrogenase [Ktedonobacteraceae bacterium]|nr:quinone-dependent dihydroorotate dehydrogenase [Ktedonobacteraceae bacterium]